MVTNKEIMTWVIEYNIYKYYNGIIEHIIETNPGAFTDVGPDRIKETMAIADDIFKNVTGTNIYEAIGLAYDYTPSTIKKKINRQTKRTIAWAAFKRPKGFPAQMESLVKQQYYIYSVLKKLPSFIDFGATLGVVELSEDRIVDITKALTERANSIYGDGTVSDISPALVVWDQYVIDSKIKKDIPAKKKKSFGHYEFDIIQELVAIQHRNHCTNAIYHLDYDGCMYEISITAVPYSK
jgi:hypothetical protein